MCSEGAGRPLGAGFEGVASWGHSARPPHRGRIDRALSPRSPAGSVWPRSTSPSPTWPPAPAWCWPPTTSKVSGHAARRLTFPCGRSGNPRRAVTPPADRGRARRTRDAPTPRSGPRADNRAPSSPQRTAASPVRQAPARPPTAHRPSRSPTNAPARRPAPRALSTPGRGQVPPLDPGPATPGQARSPKPTQLR